MVLSRPKDYRMPFSKERTQQIKARLEDRLDDDTLNQWEREFLANMSELIDRFGDRTRLSDAHYRFTLSLQVSFLRRVSLFAGLGNVCFPPSAPIAEIDTDAESVTRKKLIAASTKKPIASICLNDRSF